jgi:cyclase
MIGWEKTTVVAGSAACVLLGLTATATAAALAAKQIATNFEREQLAPNVYAFISNNTTHDWEDGNVTVIIGSEAIAVVDAPAGYLTRQHLAEIRRLSDKPVRYLINTHFHRDHMLGDYLYKDAFPNVQIVQQEVTAALSDRRDPTMVAALKGPVAAEQLQRLKNAAEQGKDADGKPLSGYDLDRARRSYAEIQPVYRAAQDGRYVSADVTFDRQMSLSLGDTRLQLLHMPGHTLGDTVVWLAKERILITGDLVIAPVPYGGPDHYPEWIASLNRLLTFNASAIVPGHGEVQFSNEYITLQRDLLQSLMDQAVTAVTRGSSLDDFKKSLDLSAFETKLVHGDPELQWGWDNYFVGRTNALAVRAYQTASGYP